MKVFENVTRFACDHCKKEYKKKHFLPKHETRCKKNPENFIVCSGCSHLREIEKGIDYDTVYGYSTVNRKAFFCEKKNIGLYPPIAIHRGIVDNHPETFEDEERMPTKCDFFSDGFPF